MEIHKLNVLGIDVTTMTMEEVIHFILKKIHEYPHTKIPAYIATLNVDFLVNTHNIFSTKAKNPELLRILRASDCVTPDGGPILLLTRLLASPLKERITGVDLIPKLAEALAKENRSIYFLGGEEKIIQMTCIVLQTLYPTLKIVGTATPEVHTVGKELESCCNHDAILVEEINKASPDVLFISFGNPKQEIWFDKNKSHLKVPVSIGVGGAYKLTSGNIRRAPKWMQKMSLEWLYRMYNEPKRLWKRYTFGAFHFLGIFTPLWIFHSLNNLQNLMLELVSPSESVSEKPLLFLSAKKSLELFVLPRLLEKKSAQLYLKSIEESPYQEIILLDATKLCHASLEGISGLSSICRIAHNKCRRLFLYGIRKDVKNLLKLHRIWDVLKPYTIESINDLIGRLPTDTPITLPIHSIYESAFFECIQQTENEVRISFLGSVQNNFDYESYLQKITPMCTSKNCVCDLTYCTSIESLGFSFLLQLKSLVNQHGGKFSIIGYSKDVKNQCRIAQVEFLLD